jgi:hypothetical protein
MHFAWIETGASFVQFDILRYDGMALEICRILWTTASTTFTAYPLALLNHTGVAK